MGTTFSANPAKKKGQVYIAKGSAPWYNISDDWEEEWPDKDKVINIDKSVFGQATVTCKDVTDMSLMFSYCSSITSLNLSSFDTSNTTDMHDMFLYCTKLVTLNLSNFNTSKVTDMHDMFANCSKLTTLDLSNFDTSNVTEMGRMFSSCSNLSSLDLSDFDTSNVTDMGNMFDSCHSLTSLDLSNFDTSNVTTMGYMFYYCYNLTTIKGVIDMKSCNYYYMMFYNCPKLRGVKIKNPPAGFNGAGLSSSQYTIVS